VFDNEVVFDEDQLLKIAKSIASVCSQLHSKGISHGDLYAHNILVNNTAECILGDFGAASFYSVTSVLAPKIERIEVRAYGCLLEDLVTLVSEMESHNLRRSRWQKLINDCRLFNVKSRLGFSEILLELDKF
jgi:serine/threonine protein kinase